MICSGRGTLQVTEALKLFLLHRKESLFVLLHALQTNCMLRALDTTVCCCVFAWAVLHIVSYMQVLFKHMSSRCQLLPNAPQCIATKLQHWLSLGATKMQLLLPGRPLKINTEYDKARKRMNDSRAALRQQ